MKKGLTFFCSICVFFLTGLTFLSGCGSRNSSMEGLFTRPELISRGRLAVLGLDPEQEQILMARYIKTFAGQPITFVERKQLADVVGEQDLLFGRLNERTRAKIKQIFGVEALVMCEYYDAKAASGGKKLRIRIVDSETGVILGSVITQAPDNFASHSSTAMRALWNDLMGKSQPQRADRAEQKRSPPRRF